MTNYNYLKIDFYGQFNADTIHKFTYPEPYNPMGGASQVWLNPITDPRALRTHFPMAKYAYRIHRDSNGIYYSYLTKYEKDSRQGYVAITVMIGANYELLINGSAIYNLLNLLKTKVLDTENFSAQAVEQCLAESRMPAQNVAPMRIMPLQPSGAQAFRVYSTNDELIDIFQFPKQVEYSKYGEVFLVNKFWCASSVPGVMLLSSPIIKTYNVVKPASVSCENSIQTGKTLSITYNKPGFAPLTVPVVINGTNNQYMRYEGATLTILIPDNLPFKQRVNIRVNVNGINYSDNKVSASIGSEQLRYSPQTNAYSAEVSQNVLAGSDIKLSVNVNDPSLEPYASSRMKKNESKSKKWLIPLIAFLAGAIIAGGLAWLLKPNTTSETVIINEQQEEKAPNDSTIIKNEESDISYLKDNDVWEYDSLKSDKYKQFFKAIKQGNIGVFKQTVMELIDNKKPINGFIDKIYQIAQTDQTSRQIVGSVLMESGNSSKNIDLQSLLQTIKERNNGRIEAIDNETNVDDIHRTEGRDRVRDVDVNGNRNNVNNNRNNVNNNRSNNNSTNENQRGPKKDIFD